MSDGKTQKLAAQLKSLLAKEQVSAVSREIATLSQDIMGESHHFAYDSAGSNENIARLLATCDLDKLQQLVDGIKEIRRAKETEYFFAIKNIVGEE